MAHLVHLMTEKNIFKLAGVENLHPRVLNKLAEAITGALVFLIKLGKLGKFQKTGMRLC